MRHGGIVTSVAVALGACGVLLAGGPTGSKAAGESSPCRPSGSQTIAEDHAGRVFTTTVSGVTSTYGCLFRLGRIWPLDSAGHDLHSRVDSRTLRLRSPWIGYAQRFMGVDTVSSVVVVTDLRTGRTEHRHAATSEVPGPESVVSVADIALQGDGDVAWTGAADSIVGHGTPVREVERIDRRGFAVLESGADIALRSLKLTGSRLSWMAGGTRHSDRLR